MRVGPHDDPSGFIGGREAPEGKLEPGVASCHVMEQQEVDHQVLVSSFSTSQPPEATRQIHFCTL